MRRNPRLPPPDMRAPWQIAQAARCGCRGTDDLCQCQNADEPWRYGLAPRPRPPTPLTRSPARDVHQVIYTFATDWSRRPDVLDAERGYGDTSAWEREMEERDACALAEAHARDWDPEDMFPDNILNGD